MMMCQILRSTVTFLAGAFTITKFETVDLEILPFFLQARWLHSHSWTIFSVFLGINETMAVKIGYASGMIESNQLFGLTCL